MNNKIPFNFINKTQKEEETTILENEKAVASWLAELEDEAKHPGRRKDASVNNSSSRGNLSGASNYMKKMSKTLV